MKCCMLQFYIYSKWKCHFTKENFFNKILFLLLKWKVNLLKFLQRWNLEMDFYTVDMVESAQIHNKTRTKLFSFKILFGQVEIMKYFKWFWYGCWLWKVYQKCWIALGMDRYDCVSFTCSLDFEFSKTQKR